MGEGGGQIIKDIIGELNTMVGKNIYVTTEVLKIYLSLSTKDNILR